MIAVLCLVASCGGGSSGGGNVETDFVSITIEGSGTVLYTESTSTLAQSGYSPHLYLNTVPTASVSSYLYSNDWDGSNYVSRFQITVWGNGPGTYNIADNNLVYFTPVGGPIYSAVTHSHTSGKITFTEFGVPGGRVKGTFDVIAMTIVNTTITGTARLTGSFSVNRYN